MNLSHVFAGQMSASPRWERICLVTFMRDDLGYLDDEEVRIEPIASARKSVE